MSESDDSKKVTQIGGSVNAVAVAFLAVSGSILIGAITGKFPSPVSMLAWFSIVVACGMFVSSIGLFFRAPWSRIMALGISYLFMVFAIFWLGQCVWLFWSSLTDTSVSPRPRIAAGLIWVQFAQLIFPLVFYFMARGIGKILKSPKVQGEFCANE